MKLAIFVVKSNAANLMLNNFYLKTYQVKSDMKNLLAMLKIMNNVISLLH